MQHHNQKQHTPRLWLLTTLGSTLLTLLIISGILWAQSVGAITLGVINAPATSTTTIPYQGRLTDSSGTPVSGSQVMVFRLYNQAEGATKLWEENRIGNDNSVLVENGLFNVMLGSVNPLEQSVITENSVLYLGITIGTNPEMSPRVQLGAVPYAVHALSVADGAVHSSNLHLESGAACQSGHATFDFPGSGFVHTDIPSLALDFTLERSSKVLVWINGLARYTSDIGESGVSLKVDESNKISSIFQKKTNWWFNVKGQRMLDLSAGSHKLQGSAYSSTAGTMTIHGAHSYQTCIYYLVLGEQ